MLGCIVIRFVVTGAPTPTIAVAISIMPLEEDKLGIGHAFPPGCVAYPHPDFLAREEKVPVISDMYTLC